jgi:hypothetical protein
MAQGTSLMTKRAVLERAVKREITRYLLGLQQPDSTIRCYFRMPVPGGYGTSGLDYEGCIEGFFFAIEAKSPDEEADLTVRQRSTAKLMYEAGGKVFIISCEQGLAAFQRWVEQCKPT